MNIIQALEALNKLQTYKRLGGKTFKLIATAMEREPTTHNIELAIQLLADIEAKDKQ